MRLYEGAILVYAVVVVTLEGYYCNKPCPTERKTRTLHLDILCARAGLTCRLCIYSWRQVKIGVEVSSHTFSC